MYTILTAFMTTIGMTVAACSGGSVSSENGPAFTDSAALDTTYAPVETKDPNTKYKPAFEGQTRVAGVKTQTPFEFKVLTNDLKRPWGIVILPDGRALITEKDGVMKIVSTSGTESKTITGLPKVSSGGQGGLLGVAIDPDFSKNRMVYWTFSEDVSGGNLTAVAKGKLSADESKIENPVVIYRATPAHKGGLQYRRTLRFRNPPTSAVITIRPGKSDQNNKRWQACTGKSVC
jgi:glucose/arabinose dehydrogenase